jgi:23S rRNA (uracil1939-C5)-methyltransferase
VRFDCPHSPRCPGCALIDRPYADQLAAKRARVAEALGRYPSLASVEVEAALPAPSPTGYRTRAKLPVRGGAIGLYAAGTHDVVDSPECRVLSPALLEVVGGLRALRLANGVRYVDLREDADGRVGLTLVVGRDPRKDEAWPVEALRRACPRLASIAVNYNPVPDKQVLGPTTRLVWGAPALPAEAGGRRVHLRPGTFFQANPAVLAQAHALMRAHFAPERAGTLLDLYAGAGAHALALADGADAVLGVEEGAGAVEDGNAAAPGNVRLVAGAVEAVLGAGVPVKAPLHVVLNPSRRGARPEALEALCALSPARVAYLSCEPRTLARDLDVLVRSGLRVERVVPLDMLPLTDHVETLALLVAGPAPTPEPGTLPAFGPRPDGWPPLPPGVSGAALPAPAEVRSEWIALVKGVTGKSGSVPGARYRRLEIAGGHSLLRLTAGDAPAADLRAGLRRLGHPVIGAGDHPPTDRYFEEKLHLARPFLHRERAGDAHAPLAPELAVVLERLRSRS